MTLKNSPVWFANKRQGFGVRPCHPFGWLITIVFIIIFVFSTSMIMGKDALVTGSSIALADIILYTVIISKTKENKAK